MSKHLPRRYSKIKSNDIVTEVDSRSKEHSFRLNLISKIFCSSLMIMLLIGGIGAQALSNQGAYAQEFQEDDVSVPEDSDANSENVVTDEGGVSIAEICGDNIDNDGDGQMDDSDLEGCIPAYEETVTEGETTTTGTGVEEATTDTPENIVPTENQVTTEETSQTEKCKNFVELDCGAEPTDGGTTTGVEGEIATPEDDTTATGVEGEIATPEDDTTATGVEGEIATPSSENVVTDEGGVSIAEICGDNIDNDGDGQMDDSDLEGCIPAYEETVTEGETTTTGTGVEEGVSIADICGDNIDNDADGQLHDLDPEGCVSIADICGDNIDNDADGQLDDLDPEGCVPNDKIYNTEELMELGDKIHDKLIALANTVGAPEPGTTIDETEFHNAVIGFSDNLKRQVLDSVRYSEPMPIPLKITLESLRLWINDPGDQWGEGSWDSNDLDMSATCYVTVPASQYKCNAYVAEAIFLATGVTFPVYESEEEPGKYFPYRAKDWGDTKKTIPHFVIVNNPQMGDVWSNGSHNGIYLEEYNGVKLYISARDDGNGVYGLDSVQHEHGIQIKELEEGGVYRTFTQ